MTDSLYGSHEDQISQAERAERRRKSIAATYDDNARERLETVKKYEELGLPVSQHMNIMAGYAQNAKNMEEGAK